MSQLASVEWLKKDGERVKAGEPRNPSVWSARLSQWTSSRNVEGLSTPRCSAAIAPSAVSKRLAELEHALGCTLLTREPRGMRLTPAGETLLHHTRRMLASAEQIALELAEHARGVRGFVRVFQEMGLKVVAEGIESAAQAEVLRISGCDVLQGYAIGGPMGEAAFLSWVSERRLARAGTDDDAVLQPACPAIRHERSLRCIRFRALWRSRCASRSCTHGILAAP